MVITKSQREDMRNCEENEMCNECVECSASVCLMSCEKEIDFYNKYSKLIKELETKAAKWDVIHRAIKIDMCDSEGSLINLGDKVKIANSQVGKIVYKCGAYGVAVEDCIDYEGIQAAMDKDGWCCGNRYSGVRNDNFISLWELYWNSNSDDDVCRFIELCEECDKE